MSLVPALRVIVSEIEVILNGWMGEPISPLLAVREIARAVIASLAIILVVIAPAVAVMSTEAIGRVMAEVMFMSPVVWVAIRLLAMIVGAKSGVRLVGCDK